MTSCKHTFHVCPTNGSDSQGCAVYWSEEQTYHSIQLVTNAKVYILQASKKQMFRHLFVEPTYVKCGHIVGVTLFEPTLAQAKRLIGKLPTELPLLPT